MDSKNTSLQALAAELNSITQWQRTPRRMTERDYMLLVIRGIRRLYIDTGRAGSYSEDMYSENLETGETYFAPALRVDEREYVMIVAEIAFYQLVQSDVNNIVGYTTDALSVTNADKPYVHLQDTIAQRENERRRIFYKMTQYAM